MESTLDRQTETQKLIERAKSATKERRWLAAGELWSAVVEGGGDRARPQHYLRLAQALERQGRSDDALAILAQGLNHHAEAPRLRLEAGNMAMRSRHWSDAEGHFRQTLALDEDAATRPVAFAGLMLSLGHQERFGEARQTFNDALAEGIASDQLPTTVACERFQDRFATEWGLDRVLLRGERTHVRRLYEFTLEAGLEAVAEHQHPEATPVTAIEVSADGGWGNRVFQLANAIRVARALGTSQIYVAETWFLKQEGRLALEGIDLFHRQRVGTHEPYLLRGRFLYPDVFAPLFDDRRSPYASMEELRPIVDLRVGPALDERELVIHVRAGDIFRPREVNPLYGQPPLSYYRQILTDRRWEHVHLVYEDCTNPVVEALQAEITQLGCGLTTWSGDLRPSLEFLLRARTMVASRGTFIPSIIGLSPHVQHVYTFEGALIDTLREWNDLPGISETRIQDGTGHYRQAILERNWANTPAQRELMLHYPTERLSVQRMPGFNAR